MPEVIEMMAVVVVGIVGHGELQRDKWIFGREQ
jgi:hypothetical protein